MRQLPKRERKDKVFPMRVSAIERSTWVRAWKVVRKREVGLSYSEWHRRVVTAAAKRILVEE